jgi:hypothetical protein
VGDEGFEPATNRLRVYCSTVELVTRTSPNYSKFFPDLLTASPTGRGLWCILSGKFDNKGGLIGSALYANGASQMFDQFLH